MNEVNITVKGKDFTVGEVDLLMILSQATVKMQKEWYKDLEKDVSLAQWESDLIDKCDEIRNYILEH